MMDTLGDIFSKLVPGETVLLEYGSEAAPEMILKFLHDYASGRGFSLVVDDIVDTFPEYITKLKLRGFDVSTLLEVPVIKIGGTVNLGDVRGIVDVDHHSLDFRYYEKIYRDSKGENLVINPVLGFHKFFITLSSRELLRLVRNVAGFVGRSDRIAIYLVNSDIASCTYPAHLALLREVSTTFLKLGQENEKMTLTVVRTMESPE
ncbi:DUF257 family protein [Thermococcus sp. 21S7]|uniref:DUF257 family protein n=1 Tax=Thermococcus sp. 21S7 TaxID=1638221 RepID=UPI001F0E98A5|nr:DUF257 family protein [Thermococcus sp. 21S7]